MKEADAPAGESPSKRTKQAEGQDGEVKETAQAQPEAEAEQAAAVEAESEARDLARVRKNKVACLGQMVKLAQRIERVWDFEGGVLRKALLGTFRDGLLALRGHRDKDCSALADLGDKMKSLDMDLRHFLTMALPIERQHTRGLRDHEFLVTRPDDLPAGCSSSPAAAAAGDGQTGAGPADKAAERDQPRMPLVLVLDNLRSAFNVGAIFRTAECLRAQKLYLCGYTATPEDTQGQTARASMGADGFVPWERRPRTLPVLEELRAAGMHVVALETVKDAELVHRHRFPPSGVALVLGNERHGIEADLLAACSTVVRIPCRGVKNSLNVGIATAICGYEIARQWGWDEDSGCGGAAA